MEWSMKDESLMKAEDMEHFLKIAERTGVKNPHWSGLTKRREDEEIKVKVNEKSTKPSC